MLEDGDLYIIDICLIILIESYFIFLFIHFAYYIYVLYLLYNFIYLLSFKYDVFINENKFILFIHNNIIYY